MGISTAPGAMTSAEIAALSKRHTIFSWSVQGAVDPIAIDHAEGVYLYTPEGQRILDFNSQLMSVNIGHGDRRVIDAINEQALKLQYVQPAFATEIRARLGAKLAEILPGDMDKVFFTLGGAEAIENAIKFARHATGRLQGARALPLVPRRDPGRDDADRRPAPLGERARARRRRALPGHPSLGRGGAAARRREPAGPRGRHPLRGRRTRSPRSSSRRSSARTASSSRPTATSQGVREICDRHGILMVADEVMAGFGRTGRWFAVDHWDVTPDLMTMAKGLTSSYLPARRRGDAPRRSPSQFETKMFYGGLTYSSHPVSLAAALATICVYEEDDLIEQRGRVSGRSCGRTTSGSPAKHPSVGATRNLGLFGIIDLVRSHDPWTPLTPFNGTSDEMKAIGKALREAGLYTMIANNSIHTNPPLCITEEQLAEGFEIIDRALDIADQAVVG